VPPTKGVIGVDVGGTKVAAGLLVDGRLGARVEEPTKKGSAQELIDQIVALVRRLLEGAGAARAVGVGVPSVVEFSRGLVRSSVNVPLADIPLREVLSERLGLPSYVDNDATCAGIAEALGTTPAVESLVILTLGTGVGGGIVIGGRPYRGATGAAAELGHTIIAVPDHPPADQTFPRPGSLERLASGTALDRLAEELAAAGKLPQAEGASNGRALLAAARAGEPAAQAALHRYAHYVAIGVANAINCFDPEVVALGGGVSEAGELLLEPVRDLARRYVLPGVGTKTEIRIAQAGPEAGIVGAALLAQLEHGNDNGAD
jgi:glucokinase